MSIDTEGDTLDLKSAFYGLSRAKGGLVLEGGTLSQFYMGVKNRQAGL